MGWQFYIYRFLIFLYKIFSDFIRRKPIKFHSKSIYSNIKVRAYGCKNEIFVGKKTRIIKSKVNFYGSNACLIIGDKCTLKNVNFWFEGDSGKIEIGDNVTIEEACISVVDDKKVKIGDDCMLSSGIVITTTDSHSIVDLKGNRLNFDGNIELGTHVWLGKNVKILKGVHIGNNSVIGMDALVTKSISSNSLAIGIPARVVKNNIDWKRERL